MDENWLKAHQNEELPQKIRSCRTELKWSQEELAYRANISTRTVRRHEQGTYKPQIETLSMIETAIGLPSGYLYATEQYISCALQASHASHASRVPQEKKVEYLGNFVREMNVISKFLSEEQLEDFFEDCLTVAKRKVERNKARNCNVNA